MSDYLVYWRRETAEITAGQPLDHAGSSQFDRLAPSDIVWVTAAYDGQLHLLGRLVVGDVVDQRTAERRTGRSPLYSATHHALAEPGTEQTQVRIPIGDLASELRFDSSSDRLVVQDGSVDGKQLQTMRRLTPESAAMLAAKLGALTRRSTPTARTPADGAVFARNHREYLEEAAQISIAAPGNQIAFRSRKLWTGAAKLLKTGRTLPIYFAVIGEGPDIKFEALISEILLHPVLGDPRTDALLALSSPSTETEQLWDGAVSTVYVISRCIKLESAYSMSQLVKLRGGEPMSNDFGYSYALVCARDGVDRTPAAAVDLAEPPTRTATMVNRIVRDTRVIQRLKRLHDHTCQVCRLRLTLPDGSGYSEGHHLRPLGHPHDGPDIEANIVIVCPNCHALLDLNAMRIEPSGLRQHAEHRVGAEFVQYQNDLSRQSR